MNKEEQIDEILDEIRKYCENNQEGYWYVFSEARKKLKELLETK